MKKRMLVFLSMLFLGLIPMKVSAASEQWQTAVPKEEGEVKVCLEPSNNLVYTSWENLPWGVESVMVALFQDNDTEPLIYDTYDPELMEASLLYLPEAMNLRVEFSYMIDGYYKTPLKTHIDFGKIPEIKFPSEEVLSQTSINVTYSGFNGQEVTISSNGKLTNTVLSGEGEISVGVKEDWNKINVSYIDSNDIGITWTKDIYIDRTAPILQMHENYIGITTKAAEMTILGTAYDFDELYIGKQEVAVNDDGNFSYTLSLLEGLNEVPITVVDAVGNEILYTTSITTSITTSSKEATAVSAFGNSDDNEESKENNTGEREFFGGFLPLLLAGVISIAMILYALLCWKKPKSGILKFSQNKFSNKK